MRESEKTWAVVVEGQGWRGWRWSTTFYETSLEAIVEAQERLNANPSRARGVEVTLVQKVKTLRVVETQTFTLVP